MFRLQEQGKLAYYTIESFTQTGLVKHCFTTRRGGVSSGCFESMNLRIHCDDVRENINRNFEIIAEGIGIGVSDIVCSNQVHEDKIMNVTRRDCGNGLLFENRFDSADGLITDEPGVALTTFYADCVPVYFLDPKKKAIALIHSGWKGTVLRISQKAVERLQKDYHSNPEDIIAAIGPSIGVCHFEVGDEVAEKFIEEFGEQVVEVHRDKPHVNLQKAVSLQLLEAGVRPGHLTDAKTCTYCHSDLLFSHRKTMGKRGSLAAIMELTNRPVPKLRHKA